MKKVLPGQYLAPQYKAVGDSIERYIPGKGATVSRIEVDTNEMKSIPVVVATTLGQLFIQEIPSEKDKQFLVSVVRDHNAYLEYQGDISELPQLSISINLPQEGDIVLVRITKLNPRQAFSEILSVEGHGNVLQDLGIGSTGENAHESLPAGGGSQALSSHTTIACTQLTQLNAQSSDLGETFKGVIRTQDVRSTDRDKVQIVECFRPGDIVRAEVLSLGDGANYYLTTARNDLGVVFARSQGGAGGLMYAVDWQTMICDKTGVMEARKVAKPF